MFYCCFICFFFFFFSSRRRHTRSTRDWSSDVCSSDLDLLTEIRVPTASGGWSYQKFHPRAQDWAIVGVAVAVNGGPKIALTNMGPRPIRATAVEKALADGADPTTAAERAIDGTDPIDDPFATAEYRRALAPVLVRRAIEEALAG